MLSIGLSACHMPPGGEDIQSEREGSELVSDTDSNSVNEQESTGDEALKPITIVDADGSRYKVIRPTSLGITATGKIQDFYENVKKRTNLNM